MAKKMNGKKKNVFEFGPPMRPLVDGYSGPEGFELDSELEAGCILLSSEQNGEMIGVYSIEQAEFIRDAMNAIIENKALPQKVKD